MAKHRAETPSALALTVRPVAIAFKLMVGKIDKQEESVMPRSAFLAPRHSY